MYKLKIMIVEDEKILRVSLRDKLISDGYYVESFENPEMAIEYIRNNQYDVVISDIKMPKMNGIDFLKLIKSEFQDINVIIMTAYGSIEAAVEAMKNGAYDYISKPFKMDELLFKLKRIEEIENIKQEKIALKEKIDTVINTSKFIGSSQVSNSILKNIGIVAQSNSTILITGETGTGKELIANIIHNNSSRKNKPFVKVSCAILSREVFESELFGHTKGSFTGAFKDRIGRFEQANGGTIYLDDIDDVPLDLQVKLLRVLQEREFERVGDNESIKIDIRCVASTKANLLQMVKEGKFREDLYYRLNVFPIHIPPLRERKSDVLELINFYLDYFSPNKKIVIEENLLQYMIDYSWPGNVRELKNIMERLYLISQTDKLDSSILPVEMLQKGTHQIEYNFGKIPLDEQVSLYEMDLIKKALKFSNGNKTKAAELLKIPSSTLRSKMEKYNIQ